MIHVISETCTDVGPLCYLGVAEVSSSICLFQGRYRIEAAELRTTVKGCEP